MSLRLKPLVPFVVVVVVVVVAAVALDAVDVTVELSIDDTLTLFSSN